MPQINGLRGANTAAEFDFVADFLQCDLQASEHGDEVEKIVIPEVSDAKHLALHRTLTIGKYGAKSGAHFLDYLGGLNSRRGVDGSHSVRGRTDRKIRKAQRDGCLTGRLGQKRGVGDEILATKFLDIVQCSVQAH